MDATQADLAKIQNEAAIDRLGAIDATGRRFEFGRTYYYFDGREIHAVQTQSHTLALRIEKGEIFYWHVHGFDRVDLKIALTKLFPSQAELAQAALVQVEAEKLEKISELSKNVDLILSRFATWGQEMAAVEEKLRAILATR